MRYRPIRRNSEFGRVYARGKSYVNPALVLYVLKTRGRNTRVGLTATKKIGHAVQRNRARRVMKAAIDEHRDLTCRVIRRTTFLGHGSCKVCFFHYLYFRTYILPPVKLLHIKCPMHLILLPAA